MPFWRCYYHFIWATKHRAPVITPLHERLLNEEIQRVGMELGCYIYAVGGTEDHIHVATTIPPTISISQWTKRVKGASSSYINQHITNKERFRWQGGYGVLTFGQMNLKYVTDYIHSQKEHHAKGTSMAYLEKLES